MFKKFFNGVWNWKGQKMANVLIDSEIISC